MNNNIIKVSFEIEDNWNIDGFRNFIKLLLSEDTKYEVFLISNDDSAVFIQSIATGLGLDADHTKICNFTQDKINAISNSNINIHLDNLQSTTLLVEETTDASGVLVTRYLNKYYLKPDYEIVFNRLVDEINNGQN